MAKNIALQMKDRTFFVKESMSVMAFSKELKCTFDACGIHEAPAVWRFMKYLTSHSLKLQ